MRASNSRPSDVEIKEAVTHLLKRHDPDRRRERIQCRALPEGRAGERMSLQRNPAGSFQRPNRGS
jgi:hypothetical protein